MYFQSAGCTILRPQQQYVLISVPFCQDLVVLLVLFIKKKKDLKTIAILMDVACYLVVLICLCLM